MNDIIFVPIIIITVYWILEVYKFIVKYKKRYMRLIPILSAPLGAGLGVLIYYVAPNILSVNNAIIAFMVGGASGLAATGTNQIFKQVAKGNVEKKNNLNNTDKK